MSTPRSPRDRLPIIPSDWSAEQALATFELLNDLMERIWTRYALDIQTLLRQQQQYYDPNASDEADPDPPF